MRFWVGFFAGLIWSNWIEYAYHRWAMHWPSLYQAAAMRHALHHSAPSNPQHITMNIGFWGGIFTTNVLLFAVPDQLLHLRILTGVSAAFLTYIVVGIEVHLRIHDGRWVPDAWRAHHLSHHARPLNNFNIFLPVFDWLLGSKNRNVAQETYIQNWPPQRVIHKELKRLRVNGLGGCGSLPRNGDCLEILAGGEGRSAFRRPRPVSFGFNEDRWPIRQATRVGSSGQQPSKQSFTIGTRL
ncbi:MAG: hypothetical protein DMG69_02875, partial [Acidobacteria bacterium]